MRPRPAVLWGSVARIVKCAQCYLHTMNKEATNQLRPSMNSTVTPPTVPSDLVLHAAGLRVQEVPLNSAPKLIVRVGGLALKGRGFRFDTEADQWIKSHLGTLDWRYRNLFRVKGLDFDIEVTSR